MPGLERPAWASLTTHHAALAVGGALARRYAADVNLFASARDDSHEALTALASLVAPGERVFVLQVPDIVVPAGLVATKRARGVQLVAARNVRADSGGEDIVQLGTTPMRRRCWRWRSSPSPDRF